MKEPEEVPADERAGWDPLAPDSLPPPSTSAVESMGASSFEEGEVEEMSELIPADDSARRDQLGPDSPPPPSAAAVVALESIGCCEIGARCLEEVEIEVMSLIPADDNAGRDQRELVSLHAPSAAADTEVMALNLEVSEETTDPGRDHLGLDSSPPPAPAAAVEPIGGEIGALTLAEVEIEEMSGRDALGLDTPSPLSAVGEEMSSLNLEESEETTGILVDVLDSPPPSATIVHESIGGVGASSFVEGEVGDMSLSAASTTVSTGVEMMSLSLERWQETARLIFENDVWDEFSSPSSFLSAVESIGEEIGDPSLKEVFELLSVDESVVCDKIGFDTDSGETGALSLKEAEIEEVSELIYKSVVHDKLGVDSSPSHCAAAAVKSISKVIRAPNLEEVGIEENSELIPVNESAEKDKLGLDYLHPPSAVERISEEIRAPGLEEGGKEEVSEMIPVNESVEQELVPVDESVNQDKLGFDYSPSLSATDAEIEEMSELIPVNESVEQDKIGIDYSSSPSEAATVECSNGEIRATSLEVGDKEEMSELIPVVESVEQDKLELDYSSSPSAAAILECIGEEIQAPSLEEREIEKLSSAASAPAAESISEEIEALRLEEGEIEELSFPTSATAIESVGEEIGDPNLQDGEIEELSPPFAPATAIESISEEVGASNLQEGEIEELFAPPAPATTAESNKEIGAPSLEEGEIEELSPPPACATAVESIREEIMAPSLEEGEIDELSPPAAPATAVESISKEIGAPCLEEGKIEELSPLVPATSVESNNDDIGAPSLEDGEMEELSPPSAPAATVISTGNEIGDLGLEDGEIEELSPPSAPAATVISTGNEIGDLSLEDGEIEELSPHSVGTAAIVSIGKEIRARSLEEGEIEELSELIPTDESEGQNQPVLDSSPRPSSAIIVTTTTVKEETGSLNLEESEETTKPIPVHESAVLDHLGLYLFPPVPAAAVEPIAEETGKPCLEEGEIEEMSEPNEGIRDGYGAYSEELEKKFEGDGTGVQENAWWGEGSADPEGSQAFGENLGCSIGLQNLQGSNVEIGWEDYANLQVSEGKFDEDGNHVQEGTGWGEANADLEDARQFGENGNGYEYPQNTGWDEPAAIWNPQVESEGVGGACQEGFASFENVGSGQWPEGGGDYGGAPEDGTGWKDCVNERGFASSENVGGEQWSEGNGDYGVPEHGAGWKDNAYQRGFALSENVGSGQQSEGGGDYGGSERVSAPSDFPQRPGEPDCSYFLRHGCCDYRSRCRFNHPLDRMPDQARSWHRQDLRQEKRFEDVTFRLLCPKDSVGGVIGKGGTIIRALQKEASASINVFPPVEESEERVISVLATESPSLTNSRAQNGILCVFRRIMEVGIERGVVPGYDPGTSVTARLLVPTNQISSLMDKDGAVITDMATLSGASIRIIKGNQRPKCASENEEVLQINGELGNVQDALFHVTSKLRENYFPGKTLHGTGMMGAYPSSHNEKASDGGVVPASLGFYPSVGLSHNLESLECQGTLAHNTDLVGLPTSIEQPLSPRVWAPQGSTSRYSYHGQYQKETETGQAELNLLGLPLRPGERECTHYMRTGRCKFSTTCRFHHPDSAADNGHDPSGYWNGGSREQLTSDASQLQGAYQASKTSNMSTSLWNASQWAWLFPPKRTHSTSDQNAYQSSAAPSLSGYTSQKDGPTQWQSQMEDYTWTKGQTEFPDYQHHWSSASNDPSSQAEMDYTERKGQTEFPDYQHHWSSASNDPSSQAEMDYTERKGQPEFPDYQHHWSSNEAEIDYTETVDSRPNCPYLLTLGTCKSGSACKYRHSRVAC